MERIDLRLSGGFPVLLAALGLMSCGFVPLVMWFVSIKDYPAGLDTEGVTLRGGQRLLWKNLTGRRRLIVRSSSGRQTVTGVGLTFGSTEVKIAPRVLADGHKILPFLSRVLGEDLTKP